MLVGLRRMISIMLIACTAAAGFPMSAYAGVVSTDAALAAAHRDRIASILDRAEVRQQMEALGVRPEDVKARVAVLSDDEAAQLASHMDSLPAGGNGIIGALVFVFLVLLITDILGLTKIFPFTRSVR
jgi:hypothetical protein